MARTMRNHLPVSDEAREIGREAEKIFESFLPSGRWHDVRIHRENDFGLDYRIETIASGQVTGYEFYVQLKGFRAIGSGKNVTIRVKTSTLRYWRNKLAPILLVAVDITDRVAYCVWFDKEQDVAQSQSTTRLFIPRSNELNCDYIQSHVDQYYQAFRASLKDQAVRAFYRATYRASVAIQHAMVHWLMFLFFNRDAPAAWIAEHQELPYRLFLYAYVTAMRELMVARSSAPLDRVDPSVIRLVDTLAGLYTSAVSTRFLPEGHGVVRAVPEEVTATFPAVHGALTEVLMFMTKYIDEYAP